MWRAILFMFEFYPHFWVHDINSFATCTSELHCKYVFHLYLRRAWFVPTTPLLFHFTALRRSTDSRLEFSSQLKGYEGVLCQCHNCVCPNFFFLLHFTWDYQRSKLTHCREIGPREWSNETHGLRSASFQSFRCPSTATKMLCVRSATSHNPSRIARMWSLRWMVKEGCLCNNLRLKVHLKAGEEDRQVPAVPNLSRICNTDDNIISRSDKGRKVEIRSPSLS